MNITLCLMINTIVKINLLVTLEVHTMSTPSRCEIIVHMILDMIPIL